MNDDESQTTHDDDHDHNTGVHGSALRYDARRCAPTNGSIVYSPGSEVAIE
jgi:hypothetical protein